MKHGAIISKTHIDGSYLSQKVLDSQTYSKPVKTQFKSHLGLKTMCLRRLKWWVIFWVGNVL